MADLNIISAPSVTFSSDSSQDNNATPGTSQIGINDVKNTPVERSSNNLQPVTFGGKFTHREYLLKLIKEAHQKDIEHQPHEIHPVNVPDQTGIYVIIANNLRHSSFTPEKNKPRKKKDKKDKKNQGERDTEDSREE